MVSQGLMTYLPTDLNRLLLEISLFDIYIFILFQLRDTKLWQFLQTLTIPFFVEIEKPDILELFHQVDSNITQHLTTKGILNIFPDNVRLRFYQEGFTTNRLPPIKYESVRDGQIVTLYTQKWRCDIMKNLQSQRMLQKQESSDSGYKTDQESNASQSFEEKAENLLKVKEISFRCNTSTDIPQLIKQQKPQIKRKISHQQLQDTTNKGSTESLTQNKLIKKSNLNLQNQSPAKMFQSRFTSFQGINQPLVKRLLKSTTQQMFQQINKRKIKLFVIGTTLIVILQLIYSKQLRKWFLNYSREQTFILTLFTLFFSGAGMALSKQTQQQQQQQKSKDSQEKEQDEISEEPQTPMTPFEKFQESCLNIQSQYQQRKAPWVKNIESLKNIQNLKREQIVNQLKQNDEMTTLQYKRIDEDSDSF